MGKGILLSLLVLMFTYQVSACDMHGVTGITEENDLWIAPNSKSANGITQEKFNSILDRVEKIYAPIIAEKGKELDLIRKWDDGTVNAYAQQTGNLWKVSMFGGLARHETITEDGFALVACHELGHHLGGAPKKSSWMGGLSWASNEGQADYFGTMKCLRKYMENDDNQEIVANMEVDEFAKAKCEGIFTNEDEIAGCIRGSMAGLSLGNLFRALRRMTVKLKFTTPDQNIVAKTSHSHPAPQCRLDTYFAGAVCEKGAYDDVSDTDAATGVCARDTDHSDGIRPLCWYKP